MTFLTFEVDSTLVMSVEPSLIQLFQTRLIKMTGNDLQDLKFQKNVEILHYYQFPG